MPPAIEELNLDLSDPVEASLETEAGAAPVEEGDEDETSSFAKEINTKLDLAAAYQDRDFRENAPYDEAKRRMGEVQGQMDRLKSQIKYEVESISAGARVRISTVNPEAVKAVQDFLRFQITDHQTGDPLEP